MSQFSRTLFVLLALTGCLGPHSNDTKLSSLDTSSPSTTGVISYEGGRALFFKAAQGQNMRSVSLDVSKIPNGFNIALGLVGQKIVATGHYESRSTPGLGSFEEIFIATKLAKLEANSGGQSNDPKNPTAPTNQSQDSYRWRMSYVDGVDQVTCDKYIGNITGSKVYQSNDQGDYEASFNATEANADRLWKALGHPNGTKMVCIQEMEEGVNLSTNVMAN